MIGSKQLNYQLKVYKVRKVHKEMPIIKLLLTFDF